MPLTNRGREILVRVPGASFHSGHNIGCEIVRHEELCVGCGTCAKNCPTGASERGATFNVNQLLDAPAAEIEVPERVTVFRTIFYDAEACLGCGTCARNCPADAIEALPPREASQAGAGAHAATAAAEAVTS
jgi:ferredoxin